MATTTPTRPEEEEFHGEQQPKPTFGPDYDENKPLGNPTDPRGNDTAAGDPSDPRSSPGELKNREENPSQPSAGSTSEQERQLAGTGGHIGSGFKTGDKFMPPQARIASAVTGLFKSKKGRAGIAGGGIIGGGIFLFSFLQGPLQFVHFSQLMQKFHFSNNDEFIEGRSGKILLYSLAGVGGERGRLGVVSNKPANIWVKRVEAKTGLRPLYLEGTFRQVGWLEVDRAKARTYINQAKADGHDIRLARADVGGQKVVGPGNDASVRDGNRRMIYTDNGRGFKSTRTFNKFVSKSAGPFGISQVGARLLNKRGGVSWHILEKFGFRQFLDQRGDKRADKKARDEYKSTIKERFAKRIKNGFKPVGGFRIEGEGQDKDGDGKPDSDPDAQQVDKDTNSVLDEYGEAKQGQGEELQRSLRSRIVRSGLSATAVVGILCATKSVGDQQEEYKYVNNILPMMRLGTSFISIGSQTKSGNDLDLDELGVYNDYFYDEENKTSWAQANTVLQEEGKQKLNGKKYNTPPEAQLAEATDKSFLFDILDSLGPLGTACGVEEAIFGLPIIKQASDAIGWAASEVINAQLSLVGTSINELLEAGLAIISGDAVNPYAQGAEFGNLANTGSFVAANDKALTTGGRALSNQEVAQLDKYQSGLERRDNEQKSFAQRYLNIYDSSSLVGSMSLNMPVGLSHFASSIQSFNPLSALSGKFASLFTHQAGAASAKTIYGIPRYGFSVEERNMFEDPYKNAKWVETGNRLQKLNDKYGKCFNMEVVPSGNSIKIESSETVNVLKVEKEKNGKYKDCYDGSKRLLRYRFYLADAVTAKSLACYYGDENEEACTELGIVGSSRTSTTGSGGPVSGTAQELAQRIVDNGNIIKTGRNVLEDLQNTADGKPAYGSVKLDIGILQFLLEAAKHGEITVTSITGAGSGHSSGSNHYSGNAIDLGCTGVGNKVELLNKIAAKYKGKDNGERCDRPNPYGYAPHDHYDFFN
jgi:hypothetical protein